MKKPKAKLIGENGNVFNLMGIAKRALEKAGLREEAKELIEKCKKCSSYGEALCVIMEYVDVC